MAQVKSDTLMRSIDAYLSAQRTGGFKLDTEAKRLRSFGRFATARGAQHISSQMALEWATLGLSPLARYRRLHAVTRFAKYARTNDLAHELPPSNRFSKKYTRRTPHIFSKREIRDILIAAKKLKPTGTFQPTMFWTLFGLLASTGLRISEALSLQIHDVKLDEALVVIRESKFRKSRLIPLHKTTLAVLSDYVKRRRRVAVENPRLFVTAKGTPISYQGAANTFRRLVCHIGLNGPRGRTPRLHDMRHTFVVRALESCPTEGRDHIGRYIRAIATYMGHACLSSTYWYFEATTELMRDMADAYEHVMREDSR